jgi:chromosome partitioning protein
MKVIVVANRKGGVGKTTTVVSLGHGLALKGKSVLLVDVDPQGHVATALGMDSAPGLFDLLVGGARLYNVTRQARDRLFVLPGTARTGTAQTVLVAEGAADDTLNRAIRRDVNAKLDYIILDTAPSVGRLQEMALWMADLVIVPTAVDFLSGRGIVDLVKELRELKAGKAWRGRLFGILPTFHDDVTNESRANLDELKKVFGDLVLPPVHRATVLRECSALGETVFETAPTSRAAEEYAALVWRILDER